MVKKRPNRSSQEDPPLPPSDQSLRIKKKRDQPAVLVKRLKWYDRKTEELSRVELFLIVEGKFPEDNDRLFGYDCAHQSQLGKVHRHWYGKIDQCQLNLDEVVPQFEEEVRNYLQENGYPMRGIDES